LNTAQSHKSPEILLIGAGKMAQDYYQVLKDLSTEVTVFCRTAKSARNFEKNTGHKALYGDLVKLFEEKTYAKAIVAVDIENLYPVTRILLQLKVKALLVEKPAGMDGNQIKTLAQETRAAKAKLFVGYNRRFFTSVIKSQELIKKDGGVISFSFEFTEWSNKIGELKYSDKVMNSWFLCNSSHVVDLAFYLCGNPIQISPRISGMNKLSWHPSGSIFYGSGLTDTDALFNYQANWTGPGRWGIEVITPKRKLILKPLEELHVLKMDSLISEKIDLNDEVDISHKPGLFLQTKSFIEACESRLCSIFDQEQSIEYFNLISGYK
tara:strand:- start:10705 stop:11673 length:969 start_codon:yes stop_codon:yes gene_type:complete